MEVKPGYKQTGAGVIPDDWDAVPLGQLLRERPSYGINAASIPFDSRFPTYLRITDITENGQFNEVTKVSVRHPNADAFVLQPGDVVFARTGASVGKSYLYEPKDGCLVYAGFLIRVSPDAERLNPKFLKFFLQTRPYWNWVRGNSMRSGQPGINGQQYAALPVALPPTTAEQEAIAAALSDADDVTESVERLLAKKQDLKQGAAQKLLTGKIRQPGFETKAVYKYAEVGQIPNDWEAPEFGEIVKSMHLGGNYKNSERETSWPLIKMGNLGRGRIKMEKLEFIDSSHSPLNADRLRKGDVLFNTRNTLNLVGKVAIWRDELPEAYFNSNIMRLEFDETRVSSKSFMNYMLNTNDMIGSLREIAIGTTSVAAIYSRDLIKLTIPLPTKAEQAAIATILSDMDAEIDALEAKLAKAQQFKQGMTQELLTGKTRLV